MSRHVGLLLCPRVLAPIAPAEARWCHPHHQYEYVSCTYLVRLALARNFESVLKEKGLLFTILYFITSERIKIITMSN